METFGVMAFVFVILLWNKVSRLERTLRENKIRPGGTGSLAGLLRERVGQTVTLTMFDGTAAPCKVLDLDEEWVQVVRNEGRKNRRELLLRLCDVTQVGP